MKKIKSTYIISLLFLVGLLACNSRSTQTNKTESTSPVLKNNNQLIVDVRSQEEWNNDGHADCSVNYPLNEIDSKIEELKKYNRVILVCRSGNRAGSAMDILKNAGIKNVENLGSWKNINCN